MGPTHPYPAVLLFGDVTDAWVDGMDYVCGQATTTPWLQSFLRDLFSALKDEVRTMDRFLQESFGIGACSSFQELAQKYRHQGDQVGMVHAMLLYAMRAALLLECVHVSSLALTDLDPDFDSAPLLTSPPEHEVPPTGSHCCSTQARASPNCTRT